MSAPKLEKHEKEYRLKTRYNGRIKKRQWEENPEEAESAKKPCAEEPFQRIKRKKIALLLGYSGVDYFGMQRNPLVKSIEEDLQKALLVTNNITQEAFDQMQTIQFQRAARTDKGVSAVRQLVSMKMPDNVDIEEINKNLPEAIRVFCVKRVTKGFNSKNQCDGRTYTYMLPTVAFADHSATIDDEPGFRLSPETHERVNKVFKMYEGTHNFHNFTSKKSYLDPSSRRYMISIECEKPFISDGVEFAIIKIKGQSFMMHQIRKMVGLGIAIIRGLASDETLTKAFTSDRLDLPMAPGLGLILENLHYDRYNHRYGKDGFHEPLIWDDVDEPVIKFKENFIYPTIVTTEKNERSMMNWIQTLELHSYDVRDDRPELEADDNNSDSDNEDTTESHEKPSSKTE